MDDSNKTAILVALINNGLIELPYMNAIRKVVEDELATIQFSNDFITDFGASPLVEARQEAIRSAACLDAEYMTSFFEALGEKSDEKTSKAIFFSNQLHKFHQEIMKLEDKLDN